MGSDSERVSITTTKEQQARAYALARDAIEEDVQAGVVDAKIWGDSVPEGEVLRVLAEAYLGTLDVDLNAHRERIKRTDRGTRG